MTKRHFEMVARIVAAAGASGITDPEDLRRLIAHGLADVFAREHPRFDRGRFIEACKVVSR